MSMLNVFFVFVMLSGWLWIPCCSLSLSVSFVRGARVKHCQGAAATAKNVVGAD